MSSSDQSSQNNVNLNNLDYDQLPQDSRDHIKDVIGKAQNILPDYSEQALFTLYKRYYQADKVFLNQVNIIARRRQQYHEQGRDKNEWISIGSKVTPVNGSKVKRYNFLEDKDLIWRAKNWNKQSAKPPPRMANRNPENDEKQNYNKKFQEKNYKSEIRQAKKQLKFKPKEQSAPKPKQKYTDKPDNAKTSLPKKQNSNLNKSQKQQKYAQKQTEESNNQSFENKKSQIKYAEKNNQPDNTQSQKIKQQKKVNKSKQQNKTTKYQQKKVQKQQDKPQTFKKQEKTQQPQKNVQKDPTPVQKQAELQNKPAPANKKVQVVKKIQVQKTEVQLNFEKSIKMYPKILKFIKPGQKMQKISYVNNNGSADQVRVYQPLQ